MPPSPIHVYIVDSEPSICTAYARLVRSARMQPKTFASIDDFMRTEFTDENACVVSDVQFPDRNGLDLPVLLESSGHHLPVIFVTAHDTAEVRDLAQRNGAAAYFNKPVDAQALLDAIRWALGGQHHREGATLSHPRHRAR